MGNTRVAAVAGAMAAALLAAGCGPGGAGTGSATAPASAAPAASGPAAPASTTGPFGRRAVYDEIEAVVTAAKLPGFEMSQFIESSPSRSATAPATEKERVVRRAMACTASWSTWAGPLDGTKEGFDKAVHDLRSRGWAAGKPEEETEDTGDVVLRVWLTKRGWTMGAMRRVMRDGAAADNIVFFATEDACMDRFTDEERDLLGW
ncbi:hypothetical protein [Streptomyces sp. NPDC058855]|uniref:hypothetical protein n=1 Tax=Streptomyces sp. NPDC058855 TaxID=3346651 RepID=UPI0036C007C4